MKVDGRTSCDIDERCDIHRQRMTKALVYLLVAASEVRRRTQLARPADAIRGCDATTGGQGRAGGLSATYLR
jgi:hypothetical protein